MIGKLIGKALVEIVKTPVEIVGECVKALDAPVKR